jgi:hypothetical protein
MTGSSVFFAYPGNPALVAETMRNAAAAISARTGNVATTWEQLRVDGRVMINEITAKIDSSQVVVAEVGSLNSNVLFEVGYALSAKKQLLLCLDATDTTAQRNWRELGVLESVGYTSYQGDSENFAARYLEVRPDLRSETLFEDLLVTGGAGPRQPRSLFYLSVGLRGDAGKALERTLLARKNLAVTSADEEEQGLAPLSWYASRIYQSSAALIHLRGPARQRASVHNARASLLAGMATGLGLPTLLVAEESFVPPIDYRETLYSYRTARGLAERVDRWLEDLPAASGARAVGRRQLTAELPVRRFGEYVAENEQDELSDYFVETGQYNAVLESQTAVFIGRKGAGKTANMLTAADALQADRRNLVTVVKPSGYELEGLIAVLNRLPEREVADYLLDAVWRHMLMTEIASAAIKEAEGRPAGVATGSPMDALRAYMEELGGADLNFAVRLENVLESLMTELHAMPGGLADSQAWIGRRLNSAALVDLRRLMGAALKERDRVAVLIDNLDKAWDRGADREKQSRMILGLLSAVGRVEREFRREDSWKEKVNVTLAVFLRADIFDVVRQHAREPDKITTLQVQWDDQELLARIIEDRYLAQREDDARLEDLWTDLFCERVGDRSTREHLLWRSLPRPRDLVYLCNACVLTATNRRHGKIEEADVLAAEHDYSRFAFDALLVEGSSSDELDSVLFSFAGMDATMSKSMVVEIVSDGGSLDPEDTISRLLRANFLGIEITPGGFDFPAGEQSERRAQNIAARLAERRATEIHFSVHPAFRPYLGIIGD